MTDSLETPESMAEPWKPSATAVPQRVGKRPAPFTTVLVLTVEHSKHIDGLAALIESRISCMDGVLDVESQPHDAGPGQVERGRWLCLTCKSDTPGRHGLMDDRVTPCPNGTLSSEGGA